MSWIGALEIAVDNLTTTERAAASLGTLFVLGAIFLVARRESAQRSSRVWSIVAGLVSMGGLVASSAALAIIWNVEADAWRAIAHMQVQAAMLVRVFITLAFLALVYVGTDVIHRMVEQFMKQRDGITDHQAEITYRIIQLCVYVLALLAVMGFWSVNLSGLLIGAGFAGIVIGMAARQTLGSAIAGFVLMFSRPFEIGDWIKVGDKDGIVTDITIVNTRIQTFDGEYVILPNDYIGSNEVVNRSRKGRLRIHVEVGVDYGTDVDHAQEVAKEAMSDLEDILTVPRPQVVFKEFADSSVVLDLRFWIDKPSARRMWRAQTTVISAVKSAFDEEGITIPFPQRSLSARDHDGGFRVQQPPAAAAPGTEPEHRNETATRGQVADEGTDDGGAESAAGDSDASDQLAREDEAPVDSADLEPAVEPASGDLVDRSTDVGSEDEDADKESEDSSEEESAKAESSDESERSESPVDSEALESAVKPAENEDD